jgi:hypothetical protein
VISLSLFVGDLLAWSETASLNSADGPTTAQRKGSVVVRWWTRFAVVAVRAVLPLPASGWGTIISASQAKDPSVNLNVAVVPAVDAAGFFIALYEGLFAKRSLHVTFMPAVSSETVIGQQAEQLPMAGPANISCGAYPGYIEAQQAWDRGLRSGTDHPGVSATDLDLLAEGSVMMPGAQGPYVMPGGPGAVPQGSRAGPAGRRYQPVRCRAGDGDAAAAARGEPAGGGGDALDLYPTGPVDQVRVQPVADVMREFPGGPSFGVAGMINAGQWKEEELSACLPGR